MKANNITASRLRKRFNREVIRKIGLSIGDFILTYTRVYGVFQGISTHNNSSIILVKIYREEPPGGYKTKQLPEEFEFNGRTIPIRYNTEEKPYK